MTDQYLSISFILYVKSCYQIASYCSINHKNDILICSMSWDTYINEKTWYIWIDILKLQ